MLQVRQTKTTKKAFSQDCIQLIMHRCSSIVRSLNTNLRYLPQFPIFLLVVVQSDHFLLTRHLLQQNPSLHTSLLSVERAPSSPECAIIWFPIRFSSLSNREDTPDPWGKSMFLSSLSWFDRLCCISWISAISMSFMSCGSCLDGSLGSLILPTLSIKLGLLTACSWHFCENRETAPPSVPSFTTSHRILFASVRGLLPKDCPIYLGGKDRFWSKYT